MIDEIIELCKEISIHKKCSKCGGTLTCATCNYCGSKEENLETDINNLVNLLMKFEKDFTSDFFDNIIVSELFNHLYSIDSLQIPKVNEWLIKSNYSKLINDKLNELISKVNNSEKLINSEYQFVSFLLTNDLIDRNVKVNWLNLIIKGIALKECFLEQNEIEILVKAFSEELMNKACGVTKSHCQIVDYYEEKKCNGEAIGNWIFINRNLIKQLIDGNVVGLMSTIFHEAIHVHQFNRRNKKTISLLNSIQLKDFILDKLIDGYYDENYLLDSMENEAFLESINSAIEYSKFLEVPIGEKQLEEYNDRMKIHSNRLLNLYRKKDDKYVDLTELFESILVKHPELLIQYPQLKLEYINENDIIRRKTLNEISTDYQSYLNGNLNLNGKDNEIKYYYKYLENNLTEEKDKQI